jgi:putative serine protease PepD
MLKTKYITGAGYWAHKLIKNQVVIFVALACPLGFSSDVEAEVRGGGSGVVIDDRGHIVTNYHVIGYREEDRGYYCGKLQVKGRGYEGWADIIRKEPKLDLAVLKLNKGAKRPSGTATAASIEKREKKEEKGGWTSLSKTLSKPKPARRDPSPTSQRRSANTYARIRTSSPKPGEVVVAYGHPEFFQLSDEPKVTTGIVSSVDGRKNDVTKFQHSAQIYHGSSGGPLFDAFGRLLGINTSGIYLSNEVEKQEAESIGFAIKGTLVAMVLERLDIPVADNGPGEKLTVEQIVERARVYTVQILCHDE